MMVNSPNDRQVCFQGAILDVYQGENNLFGFMYYKNQGFWQVFNGKPIYLSPEAALCSAKRYCLMSSVKHDTKDIRFAIDFCNDEILSQSWMVKRRLGKLEGYAMQYLYPNECSRVAIRRRLETVDNLTTSVCLQSLDGKRTKGWLEVELIKLDYQNAITLETFKPCEVRHFQ